MATINRRPPLAPRALSLQIPSVVSPLRRSVSVASKRPRSPDPPGETTSKRAKNGLPSLGILAAHEDERKEKERKKTEREAQKEEFRIKYTRAFPSWVFYFDLDLVDPDSASAREYLEAKVSQLGGVCYANYYFSFNGPDCIHSVSTTSSRARLPISLPILQYLVKMHLGTKRTSQNLGHRKRSLALY
jgi:hypothetical protein